MLAYIATMRRLILIIFLYIILNFQAFAEENCNLSCGYEKFFKENYKSLLENLTPNEGCKCLFDTLFNAYSIKFKAFDLEYNDLCEKLDSQNCCKSEIKKEINNLTEMALEEYDSFLDDLTFEICGCPENEHKAIKKARTKLRRPLKKLISGNCKKCASK